MSTDDHNLYNHNILLYIAVDIIVKYQTKSQVIYTNELKNIQTNIHFHTIQLSSTKCITLSLYPPRAWHTVTRLCAVYLLNANANQNTAQHRSVQLTGEMSQHPS